MRSSLGGRYDESGMPSRARQVRWVGESRRVDNDEGKTPIITSERNLGEWPLRNTLGRTNPVVLSPVSNKMCYMQVQLSGMSDVAAAMVRHVESDKRSSR